MANNSKPLTNGVQGPKAIPVTYARCDKEFESKTKYKEHVGRRACLRYKCEYCADGRQTKAELEKHIKDAHPGHKGIKTLDTKFWKQRKSCNIRGRIFLATSHVCNTCGAVLATTAEARQHVSTHGNPCATG
jgi:hypothetical protein